LNQNGQAHFRIEDVALRSVEPLQQRRTLLLSYRNRSLELEVHRFARTRRETLRSGAEHPNGGIVFEELTAPLDLTAAQWHPLILQWLRAENRIPKARTMRIESVTLRQQPAWEYVCIYAGPNGTSRYCKAYMMSSGRTAVVARSVDWPLTDAARFNRVLETLFAQLETNL
jgi:hypothetical protein